MQSKIKQDIVVLTKALGWKAPRELSQAVPDGDLIIWYESGDRDYETGLLQINLRPCLTACVYAFKYGVCSGWYPLELPVKAEAWSDVKDWLHFDNFRNQDAVDAYIAKHPECAHHTWDIQAKQGPPYNLEWVETESGQGYYQRRLRTPE